MKPLLFLTIVSCALFFSGFIGDVIALDNRLPDLKTKYDAAVERVKQKYALERGDLQNKYLGALLQHEQELQKAGDLAALLAVKKDREAFMKTGILRTDGSEKQKSLRDAYLRSESPITDKETNEINSMKQFYVKALEGLVTTFTKKNKINNAITAKSIIDSMKSTVAPSDGNKTVSLDPSLKVQPVPTISAPLVSEDLFAPEKAWPLKMTLPKGDYKITKKIAIKGAKGMEVQLTPGTTFTGNGKDYFVLGGSTMVGKEITLKDVRFYGDLGTRMFFIDSSFRDVDLGKGGGWFGGKFMSRWQFRNCDFYGSFKSKWDSHLTGIQMIDSRMERIEFPSVNYHKDEEPSAWAHNEWAAFHNCSLRKCTIPVSVLSTMENCSFDECRFIDDPNPLTFKTLVERTVKESKCTWKIKAMPKNLVINKVPFRP